ncbi:MAG: ribosomal protein S18-alanine N-acetyltransferase [Clostridia bacterium]|nr:ribosomal protein S18-alanine N-acetyltransferase [Clostridia bacterium]
MTARVAAVDADGIPDIIDEIMKIETSSFSVPWRAEDFTASAEYGTVAASLDGKGRLIGYGCLVVVADEAEITNLAVTAGERRQGVGGGILDFLIGTAAESSVRRLFLEVRESNANAIALYSSRGFETVGRRPGYYRLPKEDALIMMLEIGNSEC